MLDDNEPASNGSRLWHYGIWFATFFQLDARHPAGRFLQFSNRKQNRNGDCSTLCGTAQGAPGHIQLAMAAFQPIGALYRYQTSASSADRGIQLRLVPSQLPTPDGLCALKMARLARS